MPTTPVRAAGWRIEPPVSVPRAKRTSPAATATADPPDEPPGTRSAHQGFFTAPNAEFSFELPIANSSRFVLPIITAPSASRRSTTVAEYTGTDLVLPHHVRDGQHGRGRRHLLGVDLLEPLDRLEDHRELPGEPLDLIFREGDPRESSGLFDDGAIDCHYRSLPASQLQVTPGLIGRGDDWDVFLYSAYSSRLQNTRFPCRSNAFMRIVGCSPGPPTLPTEVRRPGCNGPRPSSTSWPESNANFTLTSWSRSFRTVASYPSSQATMNTARKAAAIRTRILYLPAKREISGSPRTRMPTITEVVAPSNTQAAATSFAAFADG